MDLRGLGNIVSRKPVTVLIVILLITAVFGFYAAQMQMSADMQTFLPNDEMVRAQEKISDEFGDTDIVQVVFVSNNTLSKSTLEDMLTVEANLENDSVILKNLKTPDNPGNSIVSPADIIVMGNITLGFEKSLISMLKNFTATMGDLNFTLMLMPLNAMNSVLADYENIYNNASLIRSDAQTIVLMLFNMPSEHNGSEMVDIEPLLQNITAVLVNGENFEIKAKVLTIVTPPQGGTSSATSSMENPLFGYFVKNIESNMSYDDKSVAVHYFSLSNEFTSISLQYSLSSVNSAINGNSQLINALAAVKMYVMNGDNSTALKIMNQTIQGVSSNLNDMGRVLPYYRAYNESVSKFLYDMEMGTLTPQDILGVEENISAMLSVSQGDLKNMMEIFNSTFTQGLNSHYLFYDVAYEANSTLQIVQNFIRNYDAMVMLQNSLAGIRMEINHDTVANTTAHIDTLSGYLKGMNQGLEAQRDKLQEIISAMNEPYPKWFSQMIGDLDYVMHNSRVGENALNIFAYTIRMMNQAHTSGSGGFDVFYALKDAFMSPVADVYKNKIQSMYLTIMGMANMGGEFDKMPTMPSSPAIKIPKLNPSAADKKKMLENMSQKEIIGTLKNIENYNSTELTSTLNQTLPVINNVTSEMGRVGSVLRNIVNSIEFVYRTTKNENVSRSLVLYRSMYGNISNASSGLKYMAGYLPHISGFTYMMHQFSGELKSMFSKDFNGYSARAAMMIVMLNETYLPGETDKQHSQRMESLEERVSTIARNSKIESRVMVLGSYLISKATEKTANETMNVLLPVSMILVVIILLITFRSIVDTLLGLLGLGMAISWAYGYGVLAGYNFNQISTTVAVLLVGLGIDYAIHTILRYREELRKGRNVRDAMKEMITHLGMGLILATITTIIAFLSNVSSPIPPVQDFGVMNAVGIFGAFIIFTTAIPAVKILIDGHREKKGKLKIKREKEREGSGLIVLNKFMALSAVAAEHHRYGVIAAVLLITGAAVYGGMNVGTTFDLKDFLPQNLEITDTINFMMNNFNTSGMNDNYILIEGNVATPKALEAVKQTMESLRDDEYVDYSQCSSITTLISQWEERNATFASMVSQNDTNGDGLPDKNVVGIYDWLYEHADGRAILHKSNGTYSSMIIVIRSTASTQEANRILTKEIEKDMGPLRNAGLKATLTGTNILTFHILDMLQGTEWNSLVITLIASLIVLTIVFFYERRSLILGLITSLPVMLALLWLLGTMYLLGINFNVVTVTVTSLTIGLGITYAIHITHRFLEDWEREKSIEDAIKKTVRHTGTSIFGAAATTMAGFGTLTLSSMPPIQQFGEISTLSILYSFILSVFILPTFLYMWAKWRELRE